MVIVYQKFGKQKPGDELEAVRWEDSEVETEVDPGDDETVETEVDPSQLTRGGAVRR